jgi:hypothetical protein
VSLLVSGIDVLCAAMSDFGDLATDEKEPPTSGVPITPGEECTTSTERR